MTELRFTGSRGDGPDSVSVTRDPAARYNNGGPLSVAAALEGSDPLERDYLMIRVGQEIRFRTH